MDDKTETGFEHFDWMPFRAIYKDVYLRVAEKTLQKQGSDLAKIQTILSDARSVCEVIGEPLDDLLSSVSTYSDVIHEKSVKIIKRKESPKGEGFFRWWHQTNADVLREIKKKDFGFSREQLRAATAYYIKRPEMQDDWLDWYCADLLCFMELSATVNATRIQAHGLLSYVFGLLQGWSSILGIIGQCAVFIIKWLIWFFIIFSLYKEDNGFGYAAIAIVLLLTAYIQCKKMLFLRKGAKTIEAMERVYAVLDTTTFSWNVLWQEMEDARKLGVIWDGELWRLVEIRKSDKK